MFGEGITRNSRSQWPRCLRRRSAAAHLLRLWFRILPVSWKFVCCECCVLSGRCLCGELITRPEESYRPLCFVVCDLEASRMRRPWSALDRSATGKKNSREMTLSFTCATNFLASRNILTFWLCPLSKNDGSKTIRNPGQRFSSGE